MIVTVFDTVAPMNSLCITRGGLLFGAAEFGDHALFQFSGIGDDEDAVVRWEPKIAGEGGGEGA